MTKIRLMMMFLLGVLPGFAVAQVDLTTAYRPTADACYANAVSGSGALEACHGLVSQACMEGEPGGLSNQGMAICLRAEHLWWDEMLNAEYRRAMEHMRRMDAVEGDTFPEYAVRAERLRDAQRAWIAFRDADCALNYALPGPGSIRILYGPGCLSDRTFERVGQLIQLQEMPL